MNKPQMKQRVLITKTNKDNYFIELYCDVEDASHFGNFGVLHHTRLGYYEFYVDKRFVDFDEVLEYVRMYENEKCES